MTPLPTAPLPPQDGTITVPPDRDLRAMVEAILEQCRPLELDELGRVDSVDIFDAASRRLALIADTANRLKVALEQREGVMGVLTKEIAEAAVDLRHMRGARTERQAAQNEATYRRVDTALAQYEKARRVP